MSQYFNLSFSSSQGSRVTISKNANCGPCKHSHYFNTGGSSADMDDKYKGPCCGGTRKAGDGKPATCLKPGCNFKAYLCAKCRKPLPLTKEQREIIEASRERALDQQMHKMLENVEREIAAERENAANGCVRFLPRVLLTLAISVSCLSSQKEARVACPFREALARVARPRGRALARVARPSCTRGPPVLVSCRFERNSTI